MRSIIIALGTLTISAGVFGAPRHDAVRLITPPSDGSPLLTRAGSDRPRVTTFTSTRGAVPFATPATGVPEYGPLQYGVTPSEAEEVIAVRTREPLPVLIISPYQDINDRTREQIRRDFPYARRVDTITEDLRRAQRESLRRSGLILRVRSFSGDDATGEPPRSDSAPAPTPRVLGPDEPVGATSTRVLPAESVDASEDTDEGVALAEDQSPE